MRSLGEKEDENLNRSNRLTDYDSEIRQKESTHNSLLGILQIIEQFQKISHQDA
jgi:hypothetical protein